MSERIFTSNVALDVPNEGPRVFLIGEAVPEWAIVGEHVTQGVTKAAQTPEKVETIVDPAKVEVDTSDDEDDAETYADWTKAVLRAEVDGRELEVGSKATKEELIAALEADDLANPED